MNQKKTLFSNKVTIIKTCFENFLTRGISQYGFMLSNLLHANIVRRPLVGYIPNYFMRNCVYLYLVTLLLHSIGNLIAIVAVLFVTSVSRL